MNHPQAVIEKAQRLEQLLLRLEAGEALEQACADLGLRVKAKDVPRLQAKYEAGGRNWEALIDGRYGHSQKAHSALREWMYERKKEDEELTAGDLAKEIGKEFKVKLSIGHINYLLRKVGLTRPPGRPPKRKEESDTSSTPEAPAEESVDQAALFFPRGGQGSHGSRGEGRDLSGGGPGKLSTSQPGDAFAGGQE